MQTQATDYKSNPNRYWWHERIHHELESLADAGLVGHNILGLSQNVHESVNDCLRHCREMIEWGELKEIEPLWDYQSPLWVAINE